MGMWRAHRATIVAGAIVAALVGGAVAAGAWHARSLGSGTSVVIHAGDGTTRTLPLDADGSVTVSTELGTNTVFVANGAAHMAEADCAHGDCLRQRAISKPGEQLICLPHRLWVEIVAEGKATGGSLDIHAVTYDGTDDLPEVDLVARP